MEAQERSITCPLKDCASSDWYVAGEDERSPQGAWIESVKISSVATGQWQEQQNVVIELGLITKRATGQIWLTYSGVRTFSMEGFGYRQDACGIGTLLQDEVHFTKQSFLSHSINHVNGSIAIEADEAEYKWQPIKPTGNAEQS